MVTTDDWRDELEMLRTRSVTLARGLSNDELRRAESPAGNPVFSVCDLAESNT